MLYVPYIAQKHEHNWAKYKPMLLNSWCWSFQTVMITCSLLLFSMSNFHGPVFSGLYICARNIHALWFRMQKKKNKKQKRNKECSKQTPCKLPISLVPGWRPLCFSPLFGFLQTEWIHCATSHLILLQCILVYPKIYPWLFIHISTHQQKKGSVFVFFLKYLHHLLSQYHCTVMFSSNLLCIGSVWYLFPHFFLCILQWFSPSVNSQCWPWLHCLLHQWHTAKTNKLIMKTILIYLFLKSWYSCVTLENKSNCTLMPFVLK